MSQIDQDLIDQLRVFGPESATALARRLAVSTPTVTRALKRLGDAVVAVGKGRASAYALRRNVRDLGHSWPLYKIGPDAEPVLLGTLQALQGRYRWRLAPAHPLPLFMRGEFADGLYEDLPWFLQALRPQGYLGERIALFSADFFSFGAKSSAIWHADDLLTFLYRLGSFLPGNLISGKDNIWLHEKNIELNHEFHVADENKAGTYINRVEHISKTSRNYSSVAGERPKFADVILVNDGLKKAVIVKFAPLIHGNPSTQRWADLLLCEHIGLHLLLEYDILSSRTELIDTDAWRFLESTRFDRTDRGGRIGLFDFDILDAAFAGSDRKSWLAGAVPLHVQGMIDADDIETIRLLDAYGRLIGNDDMHHGNLSFFAEPESERLKLAPVYDMLPMHYRPSPTGLTHDRPFTLPQPDRTHIAQWEKAGEMAAAFWTAAAADPRLSADFAAICAGNAERISAWRSEHGL